MATGWEGALLSLTQLLAGVRAARSDRISRPAPLFHAAVNPSSTRNHYVVTPDGQRFLVNVADEASYQSPITVMVNWVQSLEAQ